MAYKWVVQAELYDVKNTNITHCVLSFYHAEKIKTLFDCYSKAFELHFQANTKGYDSISGRMIENSDWYAPTVKDFRIQFLNKSKAATKIILKLSSVDSLTPLKVLEILNTFLVVPVTDKKMDANFWMREKSTDTSKLLPPKHFDIIT